MDNHLRDFIICFSGMVLTCIVAFVILWGEITADVVKIDKGKKCVEQCVLHSLKPEQYVAQDDSITVWCVEKDKELETVRQDRKYVRIINDNTNKVYKYKGVATIKKFNYFISKKDIDVYEIHTNKSVGVIVAEE